MKTASVAFNFLLCFTQLDEFSDSNWGEKLSLRSWSITSLLLVCSGDRSNLCAAAAAGNKPVSVKKNQRVRLLDYRVVSSCNSLWGAAGVITKETFDAYERRL